jgi:hypothetical protein
LRRMENKIIVLGVIIFCGLLSLVADFVLFSLATGIVGQLMRSYPTILLFVDITLFVSGWLIGIAFLIFLLYALNYRLVKKQK